MIASSRIFLSVFAGFLYCVVWNGQGHAQNNAATRLAPKGELRAGLIASNPVLVTRGADGQIGGVSVELARALAGKLGVPVRLIPYENPARYNESLGKDEWDVGLAARDPSRAEHLAFSEMFMAQAILAILLASATAATFVGRRANNAVSHGRCLAPWILA